MFGDIFLASKQDLKILIIMFIVSIILILLSYRNIVLITLSKDIAFTKKVPISLIEVGFLFILSVSMFFSIRIVGSLLIGSMLLLPSLTMRIFAKTPINMMILSGLYGSVLCLFGLVVANEYQTSMGATTILLGSFVYLSVILARNLRFKF
jgi:ABC-type Mn2+/Zn2+ transport system permease subunit